MFLCYFSLSPIVLNILSRLILRTSTILISAEDWSLGRQLVNNISSKPDLMVLYTLSNGWSTVCHLVWSLIWSFWKRVGIMLSDSVTEK